MNLTLKAVEQQIAAMGCERFEIGVREPLLARMILRQWSPEELLTNLPWLKHENANGSDIYIVPDEPSALVLLDDLTLGKVQELEGEGLTPCCVTETSPMNYQAWLKLADHPLDPKVLTIAAKYLAENFDGDPASATWKHFGRLAGFTNRKPKHVNEDGFSPFVRLWSAPGGVAPEGLKWVQEAETPHPILEPPSAAVAKSIADLPPPRNRFRDGVSKLRAYYGTHADDSKVDFRVAQRMVMEGYTQHEICDAMLHESHEIEMRKGSRVAEYIQLTVRNASK